MTSGDQGEFSMIWRGQVLRGPSEEDVRVLVAALEKGEERRARWPQDGRQAMAALARLFPALQGVMGTDPWDPDQLIAWLNSGAPGSGAKWAGRFCLGVWNSGTDWTEFGLNAPGRFELFEAMGVWDEKHIAAMRAWIDAPFWP